MVNRKHVIYGILAVVVVSVVSTSIYINLGSRDTVRIDPIITTDLAYVQSYGNESSAYMDSLLVLDFSYRNNNVSFAFLLGINSTPGDGGSVYTAHIYVMKIHQSLGSAGVFNATFDLENVSIAFDRISAGVIQNSLRFFNGNYFEEATFNYAPYETVKNGPITVNYGFDLTPIFMGGIHYSELPRKHFSKEFIISS